MNAKTMNLMIMLRRTIRDGRHLVRDVRFRPARLCTRGILVGTIACVLSSPAYANPKGGRSSPTVSVNSAERPPRLVLYKGERLVVTLNTTYWNISLPTGSALRVLRSPVTYARINCHEPPGSGCGSVVESFVAVTSGLSTIDAQRSICGEALRCSSANARWRVTVRV